MSRRQIARDVGPVIERRVCGSAAEVAAVVRVARASGRFVSMTTPQQADGRVWVDVRLIAPVPARQEHRAARYAVAAGVALTVAGGAVWLALRAARALATIAPAVVGVLLLLGVVWVLAGRAGACPGIHCPGCKCEGKNR